MAAEVVSHGLLTVASCITAHMHPKGREMSWVLFLRDFPVYFVWDPSNLHSWNSGPGCRGNVQKQSSAGLPELKMCNLKSGLKSRYANLLLIVVFPLLQFLKVQLKGLMNTDVILCTRELKSWTFYSKLEEKPEYQDVYHVLRYSLKISRYWLLAILCSP